MQSKDGTNTLAKDVCKQRTRSEQTYTGPIFCCWIAEKQQNIENKSYLSKAWFIGRISAASNYIK